MNQLEHIEQLFNFNETQQRKKLLAVMPYKIADLKAIAEATKKSFITPVLIGAKKIIQTVIETEKITLNAEIIDESSQTQVIKTVAQMVSAKKIDLLMSASMQYHAFVKAFTECSKESLTKFLSLVTVFETAAKPGIQFMTDAALNVSPSLEDKLNIVTNVVELANKLGFKEPKVALLAANEQINIKQMPATIHAATLAKMSMTGQIKNCQIDGPLALDLAFSERAAQIKGVKSTVAGKADVLVTPNLVAGNLLYKALAHVANAKIASIIVGAPIPIILASRADSAENKLLSIALGAWIAGGGDFTKPESQKELKIFKILVINPGSTSTKIAVFKNRECIFKETLNHTREELAPYKDIIEQYDFRKKVIIDVLQNKGININEISAVVGRGGLLYPMESGTYSINDAMLKDLRIGPQGKHESNLGGLIANEIAKTANLPAFIVDPVVVDEMQDMARISGDPELPRVSTLHALSQKAVARWAADQLRKPYEELNLVVAHVGGGISVGAHCNGRIIDLNHAIDEGCFSPERVGFIPLRDLIELAYSGKYTEDQLLRKIQKESGLSAHCGTTDGREIEKRIANGDTKTKQVYEAMVYQICKDIGAATTMLKGKVDALVLTGGFMNSKMLQDLIKKKMAYITAQILILPGELEMEALAEGGYAVLSRARTPKEYKGASK